MRFILVLIAVFLTGSLMFAQTPTFTPDAPTDLETPTSTPPEIDTGTLTPPSDDVVSDVPDIGEKLQAISTRALVTSGDGVMINGFVIEGTGDKTVVIAGKGPSFRSESIPDTLVDPVLRLFRLESGTGWVEVNTNDDWETGLSDANRAILTANNFTPTNSLESIIVATLQAGTYGAQLEGKNGDEGVGLAEVYDFDATSISKITALSTRVYAGTDADTLVGGFIIDGDNSRTVGVRVSGPSLPSAAVSNPLTNPSLQVLRFVSGTGFVAIDGATNDNWETGLSDADRTTMQTNSFTPSNALEPALVLTLEPGVYGGLVTGVDGGVGTALIEVYDFED